MYVTGKICNPLFYNIPSYVIYNTQLFPIVTQQLMYEIPK